VHAPDPTLRNPILDEPRVQYLRNLIRSPLIQAGEYSYYDDPEGADAFEHENVLYHYGPDRLIIGRFCALATGVRFIMNGANHRMDGISTFPFPIFGGGWGKDSDLLSDLPNRGNTVVGNDVWIGYEALIAPGVRIGDGAIVGSRSVVTKDVRPYAIVAGNPAVEVRRRFSDDDVERLLRIRWWDWPIERISEHVRLLMAGDVAELLRVVGELRAHEKQ
jgi:virginiamycin A acetyltransferase